MLQHRIWSSMNLSKALSVFTVVLIPVATVSLDMFYSDTKVLYQLGKYMLYSLKYVESIQATVKFCPAEEGQKMIFSSKSV